MKKKIIKSTIQLIIWLILIWIVWYYSSLTPDRQRTFFNQFNVLLTQVKIILYNLFWEGQQAREKVNFQMSLESLINLWKKSWCLTWNDLEESYQLLNKLNDITPDEFESKKMVFFEIYQNIKNIIQTNCPGVKFYK